MSVPSDIKTIPGFPDYAITKDGRVWSKPRTRLGVGRFRARKYKGEWLKPINIKGYLHVDLCRDGIRSPKRIHRLVLETWMGPCPDGMEACHNNGMRADNRLGNLRWDTHNKNQQDMIRHGTSSLGERNGVAKLTEYKIRVIRYLRNVAKFSLKDIAWQFDVSVPTVSSICTGRSWKHIGE